MLTDEDLILLYLKGDFLALENLFKRYLKQVYNFVFRFVNDKHIAQDLTQEIFLKVFKNIKKFKKDKNFRIWLFKIARNAIYDFFKKKKEFIFSDFEKEDDKDFKFEDYLLTEEGLSKIYNDYYLLEKLKQEINKLKEKDKMLYLLYYEQDYKLNEIAEILEESLNTVKSRHRRLVLKLKAIINKLIKMHPK